MTSHPEPSFEGLYREVIFDHYRHPRGRAPLESPSAVNEGLNPVCGDEVKVELLLEGEKVKAVSVRGRGCAISTASGSMLAELLPGKSLEEAERLAAVVKGLMHDEGVPEGVDIGDLDALGGVKQFPVRIKCALLSWVTLLDAIKAYRAHATSTDAPSSTEREGKGGFAID